MSDTDIDYGPDDTSDLILRDQRRTTSTVLASLEDDPEQASRSFQLGQATGDSPALIYSNLENYESQHRAALTSQLLNSSKFLRQYVDADPMHAKISNDDYGNLDNVSQRLIQSSLPGMAFGVAKETIPAIAESFKKSWINYSEMSQVTDEELKRYPLFSALMQTVRFPVDVGGALISAGASVVETGTKQIYTQFTGDEMGAQRFGREMAAMMETVLTNTSGYHGIHKPSPAQLAKVHSIIDKAKPWLDDSREPPRFLDPEIDKLKFEQNKLDLDNLDKALKASEASATRERNPDIFAGFIRQHTDAKIGISGDAVAKLYGDKVPEAGDNILGWSPRIAEELEVAVATGGDVHIPLADWLAKVDPEVAKALHDDIRVRPGGITKVEQEAFREAKEGIEEWKPADPLPEALPSVRGASALEPLFSIGDRKLELKRIINENEKTESGERNPSRFHDFDMLDENGNRVGSINLSEQKGGKQLYIEMIQGGPAGSKLYSPNFFGPALVRDLYRQIKAEFPYAFGPDGLGITGHRVSGAREKAESYMKPSASPVIKLDNPKGWDTVETWNEFHKILEGGQWDKIGPFEAYIKPTELLKGHEKEIADAVTAELDRIVPKQVGIQFAQRIQASGGRSPSGAWVPFKDSYPFILSALEGANPVGTARHEAIHHLRQYGFFKEGEWEILTRAARDQDWSKKFNIDDRYKNLEQSQKLEEAIAEGYRDWVKDQEAKTPQGKAFARLKEFFEAIKSRIKEILGREFTWEELFQKVNEGEIGSREGNIPRLEGAYKESVGEPELPGITRIKDRDAFGRGTIMPIAKQQLYDKLIQQRHIEDLATSITRAKAEQAKRLTKEWKDNEKEVRRQVESDINARPDVAADLFFGAGELYGDKLKTKPKLNEADLTLEEISKLPKDYISKSGMHPDDAAGIFGYSSSATMIDKLAEYNQAKTQLNMNAKEFASRIANQEVERQMRAKYGNLEQSILEHAEEQALSENQLNILHEETLKLSLDAKLEFTISKSDLKDAVKKQFDNQSIGSHSAAEYMANIGKAGNAIELALLNGNAIEAARQAQRKQLAFMYAQEAKKLEKQINQFERQAKRLSTREQPNMEPTYIPFIHQILVQVGKPIRRSIQDLEAALNNTGKTLEEFIDEKQQYYLREVPVATFLYDYGFQRKFEDLTTQEFRAVHDSIKALSKNARDELKITKAGEEADLNEIKFKMIDQLREFKEINYDASGQRWLGPTPPKAAKVIRTYGAAHLQLESLFNRWDSGNPNGVFTQYVMRDLATAANYESALERKYSRILKEIDSPKDLNKSVDNPIFKNPLSKTGGDEGYLMRFTRKNLITILLDAGNESNLTKRAVGYGLKPEQVKSWLDQHTTKEDWDWAQRMWNTFAEIKKESDTMYSSLTGGVEPESISIKPITTPHGEYTGGYYPIIYHPEFEGASRRMMGGDALEEANFHRATTPAGYTKLRTAYTAPMSLDLDMLPVRMRQMLHDIAMRPAIINAGKIFYDKDVRAAIQKHYGTEYKELLIPYLKDVANSANFRDDASRIFTNTSEFIRQNMISTLIGLNPGTVMKHGPTAAINSMTEVGIGKFASAMSSLMSINEHSGETNWRFAMKTSEELQRRHRHYNETLSGATQSLIPTSKYMSMRETLIKFSSTPVAFSDLLSAVPTWLAQYKTTMEENGIHGDAIFMADRAVRRAHGSTAITNRSGVMRTGPMGAWMASVYGFFNHIMNRQYELMWKAGDTFGMVKEGDYKGAMKMAPELTIGLFSYVLLPALIEEMVTPLASDDRESWAKKAAKGLAYTLSASWIGVRDIASAILRGQDPAVGLFSTSYKSVVDIARDLNKDKPLSKDHAGKIIQHGATVIGAVTGLMNAQMGKAARYGYDVSTGKERPKGPWSWMVGTRFGTTEKHSKTFDEWLKHH